jgi:hypothetical protein
LTFLLVVILTVPVAPGLIVGALAVFVGGVVANRFILRRRRGGAPVPAPTRTSSPEILDRDGQRFDSASVTASRSLDAAVAVTSGLTILSVQLLHRGVAQLTFVGFFLAAASLGVALAASLLTLSTAIQTDRRKYDRRVAANASDAATLEVLRRAAWTGLMRRMAAVVAVTFLLVAAIVCMAEGQAQSGDPTKPWLDIHCFAVKGGTVECRS